MENERKKVLIITYYWPPAGGPGVQRVLKFVKYLPAFGWEPVVLTVQSGEYPAIDKSLLNDIDPTLKVYKLKTLEPFRLYKALFKKKEDKISAFELVNDDGKFSTKISHFMRNNFFIPDARVGFYLRNKKKIKKIVARENPDVLLISSPPPSLLLIGKYLSENIGIKWVADFRDPWIDAFWEKNNNRVKYLQKKMVKIELEILKSADAISCVSPAITKSLANKIQNHKKTYTIFNGFDHTDFSSIEKQGSDKFRMSFIGGLGESQICENFFEGIASLPKNLQKNIEIKIIGNIHDGVTDIIKKYNLSKTVKVKRYQPHNYVISRIINSELLLLFIARNSGEGVISGKFFEYLATGNEILAITDGPNENLNDLLTSCQAGIVKQYDDNFLNYLNIKIGNWQEKKKHVSNLEAIQKYSRKEQTKVLSQLLNNLK